MGYALIATWEMALGGVGKGAELLNSGLPVGSAIESAITAVEDDPAYSSVGFGGLPDSSGQVTLDASYMDGSSLGFGGVMGVKSIANPIRVAMKLSRDDLNFLLCGEGAERYAGDNGFAFRNPLTDESRRRFLEQRKLSQSPGSYLGHDTVCVIGLDTHGRMAGGVSTSGLFMKRPGRVGDSPIIGSGLYCDGDIGGAAATGVGEDIMKGCLSYEIVRTMSAGASPEEACESALRRHVENMARRGRRPEEISVVALDREGRFGAATTLGRFPYICAQQGGKPEIRAVSCKF